MPPRLPSRVLSCPIASSSRLASFAPAPRLPSTRILARTLSTRSTSVLSSTKSDLRLSYDSPSKRSFHASASTSSSAKDPYKVLGVAKDASAGDVKKTYFNLAKKYHPDTNKDASAKEKFMEIQAAYDVLGDAEKRKAYDQYGAASTQEGFDPDAFARGGPFGAGGFGGFQNFGGPFGAAGGRSQADIFEALFGSAFGGGARTGRSGAELSHGDDIEVAVNVAFLDAAKGTKKTIQIMPVVNCNTCTGSGLKPGVKRSTCGTCNGTGTRTFMVQSGFQMATTCSTCSGTGTTVPKKGECDDCSGLGKVKSPKAVEVKIPAGVEDGMVIRIAGAGDMPVSGRGTPGDLHVRVGVTPSKVFRRQGKDLYHDVRIPFHSAVLGGKVRVPTLEGEVDVRVPGGTQQGEECVLRGRGMPQVRGGDKGDLYVSFNVSIPRSLTKKQRQILQQYADDVEGKSSSDSSTPGSGSTTSSSNPAQPNSTSPPPRASASTSRADASNAPGTLPEEEEPPKKRMAGAG